MITKQQLDKMGKEYAESCDNESGSFLSSDLAKIRNKAFKSGASFASKILMAEIEKVTNEYESIKHSYDDLHSYIQPKNEEIEKLKMKVAVANSDYWFMINLIERYGSDKDQTLKDCLERMKFRKPLFEEKE